MSRIVTKCRLLSLECFVASEQSSDEVYLEYSDQKIWPVKRKYCQIRPNTEEPLNLDLETLTHDSVVRVKLWDYDFFGKNDLLGEFVFHVDKNKGQYTTDLSGANQNSRYRLKWEAFATFQK